MTTMTAANDEGGAKKFQGRRNSNPRRPCLCFLSPTAHSGSWLTDTVNRHHVAEAAQLRAEQCDCHAATAAEQGTTKKSAASL
jgi:hypothetical protein